MKIRELYEELNNIIPVTLSCDWDNDGLMVEADANRDVSKALIALDATRDAVSYAADGSFDVIVTHHPLIFHPLKGLHTDEPISSKVMTCIKNGISVMSFHTRLDAVNGGVNDMLAQVLGLHKIEPFSDIGRIGELEEPMNADDFASYVRDSLGSDYINYVGKRMVKKVALVGGDGKDYYADALKTGADAFVTGAMNYNMMAEAAENPMNVVEAGHFYTEHPVCKMLSKTLSEFGIETEIFVSNPVSTSICDNFIE